jgi:hypothetical protein
MPWFCFTMMSSLFGDNDRHARRVPAQDISFTASPLPPDEPFVVYENVPLSIRDIAVTKAYTIGRRGSYKDYVELYFTMAERHSTLNGYRAVGISEAGGWGHDHHCGRAFPRLTSPHDGHAPKQGGGWPLPRERWPKRLPMSTLRRIRRLAVPK